MDEGPALRVEAPGKGVDRSLGAEPRPLVTGSLAGVDCGVLSAAAGGPRVGISPWLRIFRGYHPLRPAMVQTHGA